MGGLKLDRITAKAVFNRYQSAWLGANHELKAGIQLERGEHRAADHHPGRRPVHRQQQAPFQAEYREPSIAGGRADMVALFASDSIALNDRVTLNAGIRFDHSRASSQDVPALDASGMETDQTIAGLGTLYTWNVVSPRLGVTAKLTADGRTMLRASYGRFNQGVLTGELSPVHPGVTPTRTMAYDAATGGYTTPVSVVNPRINLALDPGTRTPRTDEYSVGIERQLPARLAASAAYIRKTGANFIAWTDTGGIYREETRTLSGYSVPVFVLTNAASDRRFLLTNPADFSMDYDGLVVAMEKRMASGWQASGSYTFSRVAGLQAASGTTADGAQTSTVAPANMFGSDPNNLTNADGRLPNDRPHVLRMTGVVHVPLGVVVSANLQHFSGKPWAATAQVPLGAQGSQRILLEQRGARRLPSQSILDLRVSKTAAVRRRRKPGTVAGRPQRARRHGGGSAGLRRPRRLHVRPATLVRRPAARDDRRPAAFWPLTDQWGSQIRALLQEREQLPDHRLVWPRPVLADLERFGIADGLGAFRAVPFRQRFANGR